MASQQYAYRAQKALGLVSGSPDYTPVPAFDPDVPARTQAYSTDGRLYAYALPNVVRIFQAEGAQLLQELALPNIVETSFSPRGTYLSTWERPVKLEDNAQHKNLRVFSVSSGEELVSFTQKSQDGWDLQYTVSESHAIRLVGAEIQVFKPTDWNKGVIDKLKVEGATSVSLSPGLNPSLAVFVAEKKGQPASIKIFGLSALSASAPTCQKTFFKADRAQIKWNTLGTQVLLLTQTEVDNSNKSYYGETGMYLLSAAGNFDCRVTLDKDGPIHDFAWSPNSKEFGVVYGYTPAKTMLFDQRVRPLHDFGSAPHNFISFNPQGRLIALAGFGNLAGKIDIIDRRTLATIATIEAPNTSYCSWSPDGKFLLTATLSPRLRVDNGVKIWHCTGPLVHVQQTEELYSVLWRPALVDAVPPFGNGLPVCPIPSESVLLLASAKPATAVKAGAYRPPGARGGATPAIFKREDEGGTRTPTGAMTPPRYRGSPAPGAPGYGQQSGQGNGANGGYGNRGGPRHVPGAPPPGFSNPNNVPQQNRAQRKRKGKKEPGTPGAEGEGTNGAVTPDDTESFTPPVEGGSRRPNNNGNQHRSQGSSSTPRNNANGDRRPPQNNGNSDGGIIQLPSPPSGPSRPSSSKPLTIEPNAAVLPSAPQMSASGSAETPLSPLTANADGILDPLAKKARNLNKKLKAIEELKEKAKRGERLEATQVRKIDGEAEIRRELAALGL